MSQPDEWDSWDAPAPEPKVQHKTISADSLINHEQLDRLAMEGWRMIQIIPPHGQHEEYVVYMVREL